MTHFLGRNRLFASRWMPLCLALALTTTAYAAGPDDRAPGSQGPDDDVMPGMVLVHFKAGVAVTEGAAKTGLPIFDRAAAKHEVVAMEKAFPLLDEVAAKRSLSENAEALRRVYIVRFDAPRRPQSVAAALARDPNVVFAEPHYIRRLAWDGLPTPEEARAMLSTPNDTNFGAMTHLLRLRLTDAWDVVKGEQGKDENPDDKVVIAVVDGGTDWRHSDLRANIWTNPDEIDGNGIDDDGNGFVDDIHGWNFATSSETSDGTPDPTGLSNTPVNALHGTAVAGVAAAVTDNALGVAGTSWNATFMGINASCPNQDDSICFSNRGLLYAAMNGADVITASWGGDGASETMRMVIETARDEGALVVASAGNDIRNIDREPFYPAGNSTTLSVGGTAKNSDANIWNYGRSVNVFAPGSRIDTTFPDDAYGTISGTSFSGPLVAGIAALVKTAFPGLTVDQLREQVRLTADNIDSANPSLTGLLGRGRANAHRAVTEMTNPAVRLTEFTWSDEDGNRDIRSGEKVEVTATFTNYLANVAGLTLELDSDDSFISFTNGSVSVGALDRGASTTVTFEFELAPNTPNNRTLLFYTRASAGSYVDEADVFRLSANETSVAAHNSGALQVSVTNEGNIGYLAFQGQSQGVGFVARDVQNRARDVLFEGGLLVATGPTAVSDCVRGTDPSVDQHVDLTLKDETTLEIIAPAVSTAQQGRVELVDTEADNPIGIEILQESFVDVGPDNEDFIILKYTITNVTEAALTNLHAGLFFDWDVNQVDPSSDFTRFDDDRQMGYVQDAASNPTILVGTKVLSRDAEVSYRGIDNPSQIYRDDNGGGFTEEEKWSFLSGGVRNPNVGPSDVSQLTGAGPFSIDSGSSIEVAFAVIAGKSQADLLQNADNAQLLWDTILTSIDDPEAPVPGVFAFTSIYPNPAVPPMTLAFDVATPSEVTLTLFDVLGRKVRTLVTGRKNAGSHTVVWDGVDEAGQRVASGLYVARLLARNPGGTFVQSRQVVVVR